MPAATQTGSDSYGRATPDDGNERRRLKIMAKLDISEKRNVKQAGAITVK